MANGDEFSGLTLWNGFAVLESPYIVRQVERVVSRTWRERLLSWPWRPLRKTKTITVEEPDPKVYVIGRHAFAHPETAFKLRMGVEKVMFKITGLEPGAGDAQR